MSESCLKTLTYNFIETVLYRRHWPRNVPTFFSQTIQFRNTSVRLIGKGVHLFSKPNHYCFGRATAVS